MTELALFFSGLGGHLVLAFLVISGFLASLVMFFVQTQRIGNQTRRGLRLLRECTVGDEGDPETNPDPLVRDALRKKHLAANWTQFRLGMESAEMAFFASAWAEFNKHLKLPAANSGKPVRTSAEPSLYFNERSLFFVNVNSRLYDAVPGFLTGGGIFGTFVGLVAGIYLAQDGMSSGPEEMKQAMKSLMGGVSTAFLTSIFGIGLSILFSVLEKRRQYWVSRLVNRFAERLETCLEMAATENTAMAQIHAAQKEQLAELQNLGRILKATPALQGGGGAKEVDSRIGATLAPAMGKMFETLLKYQENQREANQQSLQNALLPLVEQMQGAVGPKFHGIELALHALNENLRKLNEAHTHSLESVSQSGQEGLSRAGQAMQDSLNGLSRELASLVRQSADNSEAGFTRVGQGIRESLEALGRELATLVRQTSEGSEKNLALLETRLAARQEHLAGTIQAATDDSEKGISSLGARLDQQNERLAQALREAAHELRQTLTAGGDTMASTFRQSSDDLATLLGRSVADLAAVAASMKGAQQEMAALLQNSTAGLAGRMERTVADLADVAAGMKVAQMELSANLTNSAGSLSGRMERTIADLADVAAGMKSAQMEMAAHLNGSAVDLSGRLERTMADFAAVAASMKGAQQEMVTLLKESSGSFAGQMGKSLKDLAQASTAMLAVQNETQRIFGAAPQLLVATEKLLEGMDRFQNGLGQQVAAAVATPKSAAGVDTSHEALVATLSRFLDQMRASERREASIVAETMGASRELFAETAARLEQSAAAMASHFARFTDNFATTRAEISSGFSRSTDQLGAQLGDALSALLLTAESIRHAQEELQRQATTIPTPQSLSLPFLEEMRAFHRRFEERFVSLAKTLEQVEAGRLATANTQSGHQQAATAAILETQQQTAMSHAELTRLLQSTGASMQKSAEAMGQAVGGITQALKLASNRWAEEGRQSMGEMVQFAQSLDQAQGRFGQLIGAMESGAMMIAVAGEKLQTGTDRIEALATALTATQEAARQTLAGITKSIDQLRAVWHNYEARFNQVDGSLEQTFVQLNNGLQEFSDKVLQFIGGVDEHMGGITGKLGQSIGDFGSRLEDLDDSMSGFLDKMASTLIQPMQSSAHELALAGDKIGTTLRSLEGISRSIATTQGSANDGAEQTLAAITEAQERMQSTIALMQRELGATWTEHQSRFEKVNHSMQQAIANINSDLEEFSSEKILEFIGGVDEHMESVSRQLGATIGDFNAKLDDLNDSMKFFVQTISHLS
ncbi:MAG: hypothetical protein HQL59_10430 [Magnetococcales bacterium]|nr:hypothetical protein [Magnetococcales bacterium]